MATSNNFSIEAFKAEKPNLKYLHITHDDSDAVGCDLVWKTLTKGIPKAEKATVFCHIGEQDAVVEDIIDSYDHLEIVIISDISVEPSVYKKVNDGSTYFYNIDHHPTNPNRFEGNCIMPDCAAVRKIATVKYIDNLAGMPKKMSAALVFYLWSLDHVDLAMYDEEKGNYFFDLPIIPNLVGNSHLFGVVNAISEYDTWLFKTNTGVNYSETLIDDYDRENVHDQDLVTVMLKTNTIEDITEDLFMHIAYREYGNLVKDFYPEKWMDFYEIYKRMQDQDNKKVLGCMHECILQIDGKSYSVCTFADGKGYGGWIALPDDEKEKYDFCIIMIPGDHSMSLRNAESKCDLSEIAAHFGGGGHPHAVGCLVPEETFFKILSAHYKNDTNTVFVID